MDRQIRSQKRNQGFSYHWATRLLTLTLSAAMLISCLTIGAGASGEEPAPTCDEAYYATMDYYGNLQESGVVKSYAMNGAATITDYGTYDEVDNLTDGTQPSVDGDSVQFSFPDGAPKHFYFEGKTTKPFEQMPWNLSVSYKLNGVQTKAEELAGKTGLVEIDIDAVPNAAASEYSRNNFVLAVSAAFDDSDILSLEAPGAQVQLLGNLRTVLFLAMPGEEQHFAIRVGSNEFSFAGVTFLVVPATLSQLDQIKDLKDDKDDVEDSYDDINDSLDAVLDALDGMSGSLNATADGLDKLNDARSQISGGKGGVYSSADQTLSSLGAMTDALAPAVGHLQAASQNLTDLNGSLTALTQTAVGLKPELETTRTIIEKLKTDTSNLRGLLTSVESYNKDGRDIAADLEEDLEDMEDDLDSLQKDLDKLKSNLNSAKGISTVDVVSIGGMTTSDEVKAAVKQAEGAYSQYEQFLLSETAKKEGLTADNFSFYDFLTNPDLGNKSEEEAKGIIGLLQASKEDDFAEKLQAMDTANSVIPTVNKSIKETNALIASITAPTARVVGDMSELCDTLGKDDGVTEQLEDLSNLIYNILKDVDAHKGEAAAFTEHMDEIGDLISRVSQSADTALDQLQTLDDTVNDYIPEAQQALADSETLTSSTNATLQNTKNFLQSLENLMKSSGTTLDAGTQKTLEGMSDAMRQSSKSLDETNAIRDAKNSITDTIDDEWDDHTGDSDNLLLMDPSAQTVSLTSTKNTSPNSIQILLRTQEIKVSDDTEDEGTAETSKTASGTFWSRVGQMFKDLWHSLTSIFH